MEYEIMGSRLSINIKIKGKTRANAYWQSSGYVDQFFYLMDKLMLNFKYNGIENLEKYEGETDEDYKTRLMWRAYSILNSTGAGVWILTDKKLSNLTKEEKALYDLHHYEFVKYPLNSITSVDEFGSYGINSHKPNTNPKDVVIIASRMHPSLGYGHIEVAPQKMSSNYGTYNVVIDVDKQIIDMKDYWINDREKKKPKEGLIKDKDFRKNTIYRWNMLHDLTSYSPLEVSFDKWNEYSIKMSEIIKESSYMMREKIAEENNVEEIKYISNYYKLDDKGWTTHE